MTAIKCAVKALPSNCFSQEEIFEKAKVWLENTPGGLEVFKRFVSSSKTETRYFSQSLDEILQIKGPSARAALFEERGLALAREAILSACDIADISPRSLDALICTSCTSPIIPSLDSLLVESIGLSRSISRFPIYQWGCAGGLLGLGLAGQLAQSGKIVLHLAVELCSLVFHFEDQEPSSLVGAAIFADGAAAAIVTQSDTGLSIVATQSYLIPSSRPIMGYDIRDDGAHLRLDKELPRLLSQEVPAFINNFLHRSGLKIGDVDYWLFHPGGTRILDILEESLSDNIENCRFARNALSRYGNVSSASVLFVLSDFLEEVKLARGQQVVMLGVGPGLTLEAILFEYREA